MCAMWGLWHLNNGAETIWLILDKGWAEFTTGFASPPNLLKKCLQGYKDDISLTMLKGD